MATRNPNLPTLSHVNNGQSNAKDADAEAKLQGPRGEWWWTGLKPQECPGFDREAGVLR